MARQRTTFGGKDVMGAPQLRRPLNDFAQDIQLRIEGLETGGRVLVLQPLELTTGATVAVGTAPFPFSVTAPKGFRVAGLVLVGAENITTPGDAWTAAPFPTWRLQDEKVSLVYVCGLAANTSYKLTLALVGT